VPNLSPLPQRGRRPDTRPGPLDQAVRSPDGAAHFETVLTKTLTMFATEPALTTDDLSTITVPTLVLAGDDDLIELAHTCALYESIPGAQLAVVPGTSHGLPQEDPEETARIILRFLARELPPVTLMPSRRV
jgi:pimeloyl-ACP methyl ester carboxylesterase